MKKALVSTALATLMLAGTGGVAQASTPTAPSQPLLLIEKEYSNSIALTWQSAHQNGSAIQNYFLIITAPGISHTEIFGVNVRSFTFSVDAPGIKYTFDLQAENVVGASPPETFTGTAGLPYCPTFVSQHDYGTTAAQIKWGYAPSNGSAVTGYIATELVPDPDTGTGEPGPSTTLPATARAYTFTNVGQEVTTEDGTFVWSYSIQAENANGLSDCALNVGFGVNNT